MLPFCSVVQIGQLLSDYTIYMWTFGLRAVKPHLQVCWQSEGNSLESGSETRIVGRGGLCEMQTSRSELSWRCILASDMWTAVKTGWSTIIPYVELNLQFQLPRGNCFQLEVILQGKKKEVLLNIVKEILDCMRSTKVCAFTCCEGCAQSSHT